LEPFEISKIIFENPNNWLSVNNIDKRKNFFILNERFAINFPLQSHLLQFITVNIIDVLDFWKDFLTKKYNKTPFWMYIKGVKKTNIEKEKKINISNNAIIQFCNMNNLDKKSVFDAFKFFPDKIMQEIKEFEKSSK